MTNTRSSHLDFNRRGLWIACGVLAALLLAGSAGLPAASKGATLQIEMKDGRSLKGELLAVRGEELLLLSDAGTEARAGIRDVARYCVVRKDHFVRILSKCMLGGLALGTLGALPFANGRTDFDSIGVAFMGGAGLALGTVIGILAGASSSACSFTPTHVEKDAWVEKTLRRLRKQARFGGEEVRPAVE